MGVALTKQSEYGPGADRDLWGGSDCATVSLSRALAGTQINILPLLMYLKLSDGQTDFPQAAALSLVLMAVCTCVLALGECLARQRRH